MKCLCVIPARSGSKGLKDKNIKLLCGKPLIAYSIEEALKTNIFDDVMVSTDSEKYAEIAREYGASVPFLRSNEMSSDKASSWDTVKEVLANYNKIGKEFDFVFLLQPTSPLRKADDIIKAFELFKNKNAKFVVSMCEVDHSPLWCNTIPDNLSLNNFFKKEVFGIPRQSLPRYYRVNGAIYIVKVEYLLNCKTNFLFEEDSYAYVMDKRRSIDIDDDMDFCIAETILKKSS